MVSNERNVLRTLVCKVVVTNVETNCLSNLAFADMMSKGTHCSE